MQSFEHTMNRQLIVDAVAEYLLRFGIVPRDKRVVDIEFSKLFGADESMLTNIKVFTSEEQEVKSFSP
jgi:hypothetical protein